MILFFLRKLPSRTNEEPWIDEQHSPHDWAAVASFVGAGVAATGGRRCIIGMNGDRAQLIPAQHGQKVLFPWGWRAVARHVR